MEIASSCGNQTRSLLCGPFSSCAILALRLVNLVWNLQEVTVKGLEPDIQKLIAKHKAEVKKIKSTHQVGTSLVSADHGVLRIWKSDWFSLINCDRWRLDFYQKLSLFLLQNRYNWILSRGSLSLSPIVSARINDWSVKHVLQLWIIRWQAELLEADERAGRRYIQQIEELRDQLEREKENACARERELSQQR